MMMPPTASRLTCSISLRNIEVFADIGVHAHEIGQPQPLTVHVALDVMPPAADSIDEAFDYVRIKTLADDLSRERIVLIETFARRIAEACIAHRMVLAAEVSVEKPRAVPGSMASATVRMTRRPGPSGSA